MEKTLAPGAPASPASAHANAAMRPAPLPVPRLARLSALTTSTAVAGLQLATRSAAATDVFDARQPAAQTLPMPAAALEQSKLAAANPILCPAQQSVALQSQKAWSAAALELGVYTGVVIGLSIRHTPRLRLARAAVASLVGLFAVGAACRSLARVRAEGELKPGRELGLIALSVRNQLHFTAKVCAFYVPLFGTLAAIVLLSGKALFAELTSHNRLAPRLPAAPEAAGIEVHPLLPSFSTESSPEDVARVQKLAEAWGR